VSHASSVWGERRLGYICGVIFVWSCGGWCGCSVVDVLRGVAYGAYVGENGCHHGCKTATRTAGIAAGGTVPDGVFKGHDPVIV